MNALGLPAAFIHVPRLRLVVLVETGFSRALEFVHFVLSAKYQLTTAVARLRERGDREAVGEGVILDEENNPSPPASPYPLPSERAGVLISIASTGSLPQEKAENVETPGKGSALPGGG